MDQCKLSREALHSYWLLDSKFEGKGAEYPKASHSCALELKQALSKLNFQSTHLDEFHLILEAQVSYTTNLN